MKRLGEAAPSTQAERRATNRQGNRSGLLHSGERFSLCQERFPPAARNPPAYDIGQTTRNSSTAPHVEYADRHCRQKKFADNRFAANPGSIRSLSRFLYADHMHAPENVRNKTLRRNGPRYPYRRTKISEAMKKIPIPFLLSLLLFLTVPACRHTRQSPIRNGSAPEVAAAVDSHNSRNALDWEGSYSGILPCPDRGTATVRLTLSGSKYQLHILYGNGETKETEGEFVWDTTGGIITLHGEVFPSVYRVGENRLIPYGPNGNPLGLPDLEKEGH